MRQSSCARSELPEDDRLRRNRLAGGAANRVRCERKAAGERLRGEWHLQEAAHETSRWVNYLEHSTTGFDRQSASGAGGAAVGVVGQAGDLEDVAGLAHVPVHRCRANHRDAPRQSALRHRIPRPSVEFSAGDVFARSAPLLEEEGRLALALIA